jgi:hypothetical protein
MSIKSRLKTAIQNKSWKDICSLYEELFDEPIEIQKDDVSDANNDIKTQFLDLAKKMGLSLTDSQPSDSSDLSSEEQPEEKKQKKTTKVKKKINIEVNSAPEIKIPKIPNVSGPVKGRKPVLFGDFSKDDDVAELSRAVAEKTNKDKRPPKQPKIVVCEECSSKFDFNKVYPVGIFASQRALCDKCRSVKK